MENPKMREYEEFEAQYAKLGGKDKFNLVLGLFGSTSARENFLDLCEKYFNLPKSSNSLHGEDYKVGKRKYSPPEQAIVHNAIMDILQRLATEAKNLNAFQTRALNEMANRAIAGDFIKQYFLAEEGREEDDEDEQERKRQKMSPTAHFHSMGKEH